MSDIDNRLEAALSANPAPARDARFRIEVLLRIERARFKRRVVTTLAVALAGAFLVVMNATAIDAWIAMDIWRASLAALAAIAVTFFLSGVPVEAVPGFRRLARVRRWLYSWR
jgi:hypothetical protein